MQISLGPSATIRSIHDLKQAILDGFAGGEDIAVDAGELVEVDLSLVQLLDAARRHAAGLSRNFTLVAPAGDALTALLRRAGVLTAASDADRAFWLQETATP